MVIALLVSGEAAHASTTSALYRVTTFVSRKEMAMSRLDMARRRTCSRTLRTTTTLIPTTAGTHITTIRANMEVGLAAAADLEMAVGSTVPLMNSTARSYTTMSQQTRQIPQFTRIFFP